MIQFMLGKLSRVATETYEKHIDLGIVLVAGMIFDPALTAIFAAAVLILVSKYHFPPATVTYIMGLAIIFAIPAVPLSRWLASTPLLNGVFGDGAETTAPVAGTGDVSEKYGSEKENVVDSAGLTAGLELSQLQPLEASSERNQVADVENSHNTKYQVILSGSAAVELEYNNSTNTSPSSSRRLNEGVGSTSQSVRQLLPTDEEHSNEQQPRPASLPVAAPAHVPVVHPHRTRCFLMLGLLLVIINNLCVISLPLSCNLGLACLLSSLWGFELSFCWNSLSMLRAALVPGGRESEFAGLYLAMYSGMIWLPLFVFSLANEVWNIDGALYVLIIFLAIGMFILAFVHMDRALASRKHTLDKRRWVPVVTAAGSKAKPLDVTQL